MEWKFQIDWFSNWETCISIISTFQLLFTNLNTTIYILFTILDFLPQFIIAIVLFELTNSIGL